MKRRTEITVETNLLIIRPSSARASQLCAECPSPVLLITPEEAAVLARVSTRDVYRWVEAAQLHFTETADGRLFVCPRSLPLC
jgi:excisionase family DNA binding protein